MKKIQACTAWRLTKDWQDEWTQNPPLLANHVFRYCRNPWNLLTKSEQPKTPCFCDTSFKVMLSNFILIISVPIEIFWLASERPVLMARYIQASNGIFWIIRDFMIETCLNSATFTIIFSCFWSEANRTGLKWDSDQIFILEVKTRRLFLDLKLNNIW